MAATLLIAVSAVAVLVRKTAPYLAFGWLWFLGNLVPMIGIVQVGEQARADRYMYIPLIGILVAAVWGLAELFNRLKINRSSVALLFAIATGALSFCTYHQIGFWRDSETLWNYTISVIEDNFMAEDNLAQDLAHQGRTEEALVHFHRALALHSYEPSQFIAFGMYEQRNGYPADAIKQYQRAFDNSTDAATRAVALTNIGSAYMETKDLARANTSFHEALQLDPNNVPALVGRGLIAHKNGNLQLAISQYTSAVSIQPSDLGYELLGLALQQSGRAADANKAYEQARQLSANPEDTRKLAEHLLRD